MSKVRFTGEFYKLSHVIPILGNDIFSLINRWKYAVCKIKAMSPACLTSLKTHNKKT